MSENKKIKCKMYKVGYIPQTHVAVPFVERLCGREITVHRDEIQKLEVKYDIGSETARYVYAAILLTKKGVVLPDNFPVKLIRSNSNCRIKINYEGARNFDRPVKVVGNKKVPAKKRTNLRDAIQSTAKVAKTEPEDKDIKTDTTEAQSNKPVQSKKNKKHQGKSKTFKRKTQRPGRI